MNMYQNILNVIKDNYIQVLGDNLVGIYIHGSIAFQCFNWEESDIDIIVVINNTLDVNTKLKLLEVLESIRSEVPRKGLEVSIVLRNYCENFQYPTPYELHFSNYWLERYLKDPLLLCGNEKKTDPDLAAHFTVIKHVGIVLYGIQIDKVFGNVEKRYYIESIKSDITDARTDVESNPVYIILNLCRVLAYLQDNVVLSKQQGGDWGLNNLESGHHHIIHAALNTYSSKQQFIAKEKDQDLFCEYMLTKIGAYN